MSKVMRSTSMEELLQRMVGEYRAKRSLFDIGEAQIRRAFELAARSPGWEFLGATVALPVGPAAGPHTQAAPNIVAAFLTGARVFELKTVQENDRIEVAKPCIEALDEGYNVEWSTELSLEQARAEYLHAWAALHLLEALFAPAPSSSASRQNGRFLFNLSVGYTLSGIASPRMDSFIEGMRSPEGSVPWNETLEALRATVNDAELSRAFGEEAGLRAREIVKHIPAFPVHSVTLSTMHGCPPEEIERIGRYLISEKGLSTLIKLNPTLLGYDRVRSILDDAGFHSIRIEREVFEKDLQLGDALSLIEALAAAARTRGVGFGLKLSNTLAVVNDRNRIPGREMYLSGRALFPVTARLAAELAASLPDPPPFSFCAGVSARNAADCLAAGLGPLTVATELLKPGGYARLEPIAAAALRALPSAPRAPCAASLDALARSALRRPEHRADFKRGGAAIARRLPFVDCFAAPCVEACPVHQKAPAYIRALAAGRVDEALEIVLADNPLPTVTGLLCDHPCMSACARNDYEGPVSIRALKLACALGADSPIEQPSPIRGRGKTAVVGAGPAGLACANELARAGYPVVVFEQAKGPGGVAANVIPRFRIERRDIERDVDRLRSLGVEFRFGVADAAETVRLDRLREQGFTSFVIAAGAPVSRLVEVEGDGVPIVGALEFLAQCRSDPSSHRGRPRIVVVGGGNTAMDAARVALRLPEVQEVKILYRRTRVEMPADREELEAALAEGAVLCELALPERIEPGRLSARIMRLGDFDSSGRRAALPTDRAESHECDLLVSAVGEMPDRTLFDRLGLAVGSDGIPSVDPRTLEGSVSGLYVAGDAARGPSSIVRAEADGRRAAQAILHAAGIGEPDATEGATSRSRLQTPPPAAGGAVAKTAEAIRDARGRILESVVSGDPGFVAREAERCLSCDLLCLRCVEVCPNRANVAIPVRTGGCFAQSPQILHLDDLCNECGNCATFCPYEGDPYRDKPTLFSSEAALLKSDNDGFVFIGRPDDRMIMVRAEGSIARLRVGDERREQGGGTPATPAFRQLVSLARTILAGHSYLVGRTVP